MASVHIRAGELKHQVQLQQQVTGEDASGTAKVWQNLGTPRYAKIESTRGADSWRQGQFTSEKYMTVTMRYRSDVLANMRLIFKGRTFTIIDVVNVDEAKVRLDILCVELDGK
jgi:SPP1 family predicted phage head-tail adaptor